MATPQEMLATLEFLAPALSAVSEADKLQALQIASGYRPWCLPEEKQDEAQIYYAIWLLFDRKSQADAAAAADDAPVVARNVKSIREGDVQYTWASAAEMGSVYDPSGYYARWQALYNVCGVGAITVGRGRRYGCGC